MTLLESVQAIVPEAKSLAEAIQIRKNEYNESLQGRDTSDIEKYTQEIEKSNLLAKEVILLMRIENSFFKTSRSQLSSVSNQEVPA